MITRNYIDNDFLKQLDDFPLKVVYVRIIALNLLEESIETIEGRVTAGSINIDGASAVRRTCSLTLLVDENDLDGRGIKYSDHLWGLQTRFKLEVGLQNSINNNYDDIIWFNQGVYIITSFNKSKNANGFSISISGKDKMSLLNGEIGGAFESEINFGEIEEEKVLSRDSNGKKIDSVWETRKLPVEEIIRNMIHVYGREPLHNIIIKDLPNYGLELLEYRGDEPMYAYKKENRNQWENILTSMDQDKSVYYKRADSDDAEGPVAIKKLPEDIFTKLTDSLSFTESGTISFSEGGADYLMAKFDYGDTSGYRATDLTYPGELIAKAGETITSVLDKIKNVLVQFEYFYDLEGRFIFQKKKSFTGNLWSPVKQNENGEGYIDTPLIEDDSISYVFKNHTLLTTFNNNPNINNLKNDFSIWGSRKGILGAAIPIHLRYAIDSKPTQYTSIGVSQKEVDAYNKKYNTDLKPQKPVTYSVESASSEVKVVDWREIIYQMARDQSKYNFLDDFEARIIAYNKDLYPSGMTGYEQYYIDLLGFWRQLYNPEYEGSNPEDFYPIDHINKFWCKNVFENPESLNFWFDFLDSPGSELNKYNVKNIGSRPKVINDTKINSIYYRDTPTIIYTQDSNNQIATGYFYAQLPKNYENLFSISAQGLSAKNKLDDLLYEHAFCVDSVTINAIPIYYLEPNTLIKVQDESTELDGEYIVSKITLPLTYNGTMSITASKAIQSII